MPDSSSRVISRVNAPGQISGTPPSLPQPKGTPALCSANMLSVPVVAAAVKKEASGQGISRVFS